MCLWPRQGSFYKEKETSLWRFESNARGVNQYQGRPSESISQAAYQRLPNARATRARTAVPCIKHAFYWGSSDLRGKAAMIKTHGNFVCRLTTVDYNFLSARFH
jgi:hypothetical protein